MIDNSPIFVTGLANSGKTPLRVALSSLPGVCMTRKTYLWRRYHGRYGDLSNVENLRALLQAMDRDPDLDELEPDLVRMESDFLERPGTYTHLFGLFYEHHARRTGNRRWGEQQGGVERFIEEILGEWPSARMIHLVREPRNSLPERARASAAKLGWHTARWITSAEVALRNEKKYRGSYRVLRYEDLLADPAKVLREVCEFLGEAYVPQMLTFLEEPSVRRHLSRPDGGVSGGTDRSSAFVEYHARLQLDALGYPVRFGSQGSWRQTRPVSLAGLAAWRLIGSRRGEAS